MALSNAFALIASGSPYLTALLRDHEDWARKLTPDDVDDECASVLAETAGAATASSRAEAMRMLRQSKQKLALLVALCDLAGLWTLEQVTMALTRFADAAVQAALAFLWREERAKGHFTTDESGRGYLVLAMGKMGAFELNYSSDIDLIVFYDPGRAPLRADLEPSMFFVKLTRALVAMLQDITADGYVFRTDLRLRPDPRATQVAIHIEAAATYYETQGQNWERAAMIKARACAGDMVLGAEFISRMKPYIWRKYLDYAAIADVQSMKRQIHAVKGHGEIAVLGHNLKLGRGGIREIEFFVQTQQLIAGGRNPVLRCTGTVAGLEALAHEKWIGPETAGQLTDAYRFLRTLEHRAQMMNDQQTHDTPADPEKFEVYARFSGFPSAPALAEKLRATLETVQRHYAALFEAADDLSAGGGSLVFTGGDDDPATLETLRRMGYDQVTEIAATIRAWHFGRYRATRTARAREILTEIMPALLQTLAQSGEADRAFFAFDKFLESLSSGVQVLSMMRANPRMLSLIAQILGSAPRLAEKISAQPRMLEAVMVPDFFAALPMPDVLDRELETLIPAHASLEEAMDVARLFAREKNFRVGARILSETIGVDEAGFGFSNVADAVLVRLLKAVLHEVAAKHGAFAGSSCIVLGLGKLGGREMTAGSDLDIMLIYDHDEKAEMSAGARPLPATQYFAKVTQALMTALTAPTSEGRLYEVDMRLRPSGSKGPLAVSLGAFAAYHQKEAWTWERMAMTRARVVAGEAELGERVHRTLRTAFAAPRPGDATRKDIAQMRALMLKEHQPESVWDLKRAVGGQVEIEFIAQYLQLTNPGLVNANTAVALHNAAQANLLRPAEAETLLQALGLYQRLTHLLRLCVDGRFDQSTAPAHLLSTLSQTAGQPDISATAALLAETQIQVARLFMHHLG